MQAFEELFTQYLNKTGAEQAQAAVDIALLPDAVPLLCEMLDGGHRRAALALLSRCVKKLQHKKLLQEADSALLLPLLFDDDAKTRKNAAVLIGSLENEAYVPSLVKALQEESQQFVRPSIILALGAIGGTAARQALCALAPIEGDDKHAREQRDALQKAQSRVDPKKRRTFTGFRQPLEVCLAPVSGLSDVLLQEGQDKGIPLELRGGVPLAQNLRLRVFVQASRLL